MRHPKRKFRLPPTPIEFSGAMLVSGRVLLWTSSEIHPFPAVQQLERSCKTSWEVLLWQNACKIMRGEWPEKSKHKPTSQTFWWNICFLCMVGYRLHAPRAKWDKHCNLARRIVLKSFKISAAMRLKNQKCPVTLQLDHHPCGGNPQDHEAYWHNDIIHPSTKLYKKRYIYICHIYIYSLYIQILHTHTICIITLPSCMFKTKVLSLEGRNPPWIKRQVLAAQGPKHHFPPGQFCNLGIFGDLLNNTKKKHGKSQ